MKDTKYHLFPNFTKNLTTWSSIIHVLCYPLERSIYNPQPKEKDRERVMYTHTYYYYCLLY